MVNLRAPTLYHIGKQGIKAPFLAVEKDIMIWCNSNLNFGELRYLYALMQCAGDGSFAPSAEYLSQLTGMSKVLQSRARAALKEKGILEHEDKKYIKVRYDKLYKLAKEKA